MNNSASGPVLHHLIGSLGGEAFSYLAVEGYLESIGVVTRLLRGEVDTQALVCLLPAYLFAGAQHRDALYPGVGYDFRGQGLDKDMVCVPIQGNDVEIVPLGGEAQREVQAAK